VPPHRYHMARRIDRAKGLLEKPALSVTQIGIQIGFREASSFTRAFRKFTGLTPTEYRRQREH
jgi:AraC family transcriptional regulator